MIRACYRGLLWLHPPLFRRQFAVEMLWIFDQAAESQGALTLLRDGLASLVRQWLLRSGWWKIAAALALALLEIVFGGFGTMLFAPGRIIRPAAAHHRHGDVPGCLRHRRPGGAGHRALFLDEDGFRTGPPRRP
jgi:hypothetical protein